MSPTTGVPENGAPPNITRAEILSLLHPLTDRVRQLEEQVKHTQATASAVAQMQARIKALEHLLSQICRHPQFASLATKLRVEVTVDAPPLPNATDQHKIVQLGLAYLGELLGRTTSMAVYDSLTDAFTAETLFTRLANKPNVAVIGFTDDNDVFGGFFPEPLRMIDETYYVVSVQTRGRASPRVFRVHSDRTGQACVTVCSNNREGFIHFGVTGYGGFWLGNTESHTHCYSLSQAFQEIDDTTLTDAAFPEERLYFRNTRLVAYQFF